MAEITKTQLDSIAKFLVVIRKTLRTRISQSYGRDTNPMTSIILMDRVFYNTLVNVCATHMPEQAPKRVPKDELIHPFTFLGIPCRVICDKGIGYSIGLIE